MENKKTQLDENMENTLVELDDDELDAAAGGTGAAQALVQKKAKEEGYTYHVKSFIVATKCESCGKKHIFAKRYNNAIPFHETCKCFNCNTTWRQIRHQPSLTFHK